MENAQRIAVYRNVFGFRGDLLTVVGLERIKPRKLVRERGRIVGFWNGGKVVRFAECPGEWFTFAPGWR